MLGNEQNVLAQYCRQKCNEKTFYLTVNVFSTKVLIEDTIFMFTTGDRTAVLHGHMSHVKDGLVRQNSRHFVTPHLVSPQNDV